MYVDVTYPEDRPGFYRMLQEQLALYVGEETDRTAALANFSSVLKVAFSGVNWAGFYLIQGDALVLGPFQGRPAVSRIPYGAGVCGAAWRENDAMVVEDVDCFAGHIACDCNTHSEIVIPLRDANGAMWGVLDMDSTLPGRFTQEDRAGLEACTELLTGFARHGTIVREKSCGAVVFTEQDGQRLYLVEEMRQGHISLCKGHVEGDETEHQTARREILEETALEVTFLEGFRHTIRYSPREGHWKDVVFFLASTQQRETRVQPEEVTGTRWLPAEEAAAALTYASDRETLLAAEAFLRTGQSVSA